MLRKILLDTRAGETVLAWFEALTGLAIVDAETLADERANVKAPAAT